MRGNEGKRALGIAATLDGDQRRFLLRSVGHDR